MSIDQLSRLYEVTGANIINVVQYACLQKLKKKASGIQWVDLINGIRKEYVKEDKMFA